ncbi:MAG: sensor histidine kinase [Flavobacteriales bacterium]
MTRFLLILLFFISILTFAQDPSYSVIGKKEFSGYDIYSIAQNNEGIVYLATNNGVFKHNGKEIIRLESPKLRDKSFFGFIKNKTGDLFCYNLIGEVYKVGYNTIYLETIIKNDFLSGYFTFQFTENDEIIISLPNPIIKRKDSTYENLFPDDVEFNSSILKSKKNKILLYSHSHKRIYFIDSKTLETHYLSLNKEVDIGTKISFDDDDDRLYMLDHKNHMVYEFNEHTYKKIPLAKPKFNYGTEIFKAYEGGQFCVTFSNGGMVFYSKDGTKRSFNDVSFNSVVFSCFLQDSEGNFWAGTLEEAILYFRRTPFFSFVDQPLLKDEFIHKIAFCPAGNLYIGTMSGKIYEEDNFQIKLFNDNSPNKVNYLEYKNNVIYASRGIFPLKEHEYNALEQPNKKNIGKDFEKVDGSYFYGTSRGLLISPENSNTDSLILTARIHKVRYIEEDDKLWVASNKGLYYYHNNHLHCSNLLSDYYSIPIDLQIYEDKLWVATESDGVFLIDNDKIVVHLKEGDGLESNEINKIRFQNDRLFISHAKGLQINQISEIKKYKLINRSNGLFANNIRDFDVMNNQLALVTYLGLQKVDLNTLYDVDTLANVHLIKVSSKEGELFGQNPELNYYNQSVTFEYETYAFQHEIHYEYRLIKDQDSVGVYWVKDFSGRNSITFPSLSSGSYTFNLRAVSDHNVKSDIVEYTFVVKNPFWKTTPFLGLVGFLLSGLIYLIYSRNVRKIKKENSIKAEIYNSKLTALKSQMNPHFIFNSLNSIQALVLKQDVGNAYNYIVKFSTLVRQTLNFSDKDYIDFQEEVKMLKLYLELEKLRFSDDFSFEITFDKHLNGGIPPMLIQPFVENAIKHGLLHKTGDKSLKIHFEIDELLTCIILDNGVGMKRSQEIKMRQGRKYKSFSITSLGKRFNILSEMHGSQVGFEIIDLSENSQGQGTKVIIKIPINYQL